MLAIFAMGFYTFTICMGVISIYIAAELDMERTIIVGWVAGVAIFHCLIGFRKAKESL